MTDVEKERLMAFARDMMSGKDSSAQHIHWRLSYHRNDVAGDKLTIEAIAPDYTVQSVMNMLMDTISQIKSSQFKDNR